MHHNSNKILTKSKLVFLVKRYAPHIGGVELHVAKIAHELRQNWGEIVVVTEQYDPSLPLFEVKEGVNVYRIPYGLNAKKQIWIWMVQHYKIFTKANIIHAHDVGWWYLPYRLLFWWKPFYTTFHGYEGAHEPTMGAVLSRKLIEWCSTKIMCVGDWMREWYKEKPDVVMYGAASFHHHPLPQTKDAVFIGRLSPDTGVLEYIKAVMQLKGKIRLDIFGEGELQNQIQKLIVKTPYIQFKGALQHKDVEKELTSHRFAFVSRYLGIIEAQQVGRLVFAHTDSHIKTSYLSAFPTAAQTIRFHDAETLIAELEYIVKNPALEGATIQTAQKWATQQTWDRIATLYEELWQQ